MVYNYIPKILTTGAHQTRPCLNPELNHVSVLIIFSPSHKYFLGQEVDMMRARHPGQKSIK